MAATRYEPWEVLNQLQGQISRIFENQVDSGATTSAATADWIPPADVEEYADRFVLKLDLPGVNLAAVDITLDQGVLSISGQREKEARSSALERSRTERVHGRFHRRFTLPDTVDAASVTAQGTHGVLEVVIPKQPKAQPRRIAIVAG